MTEYVKRDDVLNYAYEIRPCKGSYFNTGVAEAMVLDANKEIADELENLPFTELPDEPYALDKWISIDDDLPKKASPKASFSDYVLCIVDNRGIDYLGRKSESSHGKRFIKIGKYDFRYDRFNVPGTAARVTYWMPLPKFPEESEYGYWLDDGSLSARCYACGCKTTEAKNYCPICGARNKHRG